MPSLFARLRYGRNANCEVADEKSNGDAVRESNVSEKPSSEPASSGWRLRSWLSLKHSRKEQAKGQPSARPPTPTPHVALSSNDTAKRNRPRVLKRKRPPAVDPDDVSKEEKGKQKAAKGDDDDDKDGAEGDGTGMTDEERKRLAYFANGVRGLIAELKIRDKESRSTPPITNTEGTPLSPISEADELEREHEAEPDLIPQPQPQYPIILQSGARTPSSDEVTDLDYGEVLYPGYFDMEMEVDMYLDSDEEAEWMPRWSPDVAELVQSETEGSHQEGIPSETAPPTSASAVPDEEGRVDDTAIERELSQQDRDEAQNEVETEDELEYFSAPSVPLSSGEEDEGNESDDTSGPGTIGLALRGLEISSSSSSDTLNSDSSDDNDRTVEGPIITPGTPGRIPRQRVPSQPHPMFRPETIDGAPNNNLRRQRATTLPVGQVRALPALPRLSIPSSGTAQPKEGSEDVAELGRTIAQLQREKARLEEALAQAKKTIELKDSHIVALNAQILKLRSTLVKVLQGELDALTISSDSSEDDVPVVVRAPSEPRENQAEEPAQVNEGLSAPLPSANAGSNPLSTPPATPDRRAAVALSKDAQVGEVTRSEEDADSTPKPVRGLVRRNSAGPSSAFSELDIGRTQVKRRIGSEDLKSMTASLSQS